MLECFKGVAPLGGHSKWAQKSLSDPKHISFP